MTLDPKLPADWLELLHVEFSKEYFFTLKKFLVNEREHYRVYPKGVHMFNAFNSTSVEDLKVVILGQDPYHGPNQAHGLAFSVQEGITIPPSLVNIFKELEDDMGCHIPKTGSLQSWADQGVFLLNTVLSVREGMAHSHRNQGWEVFTDAVLRKISEEKEHVVFILWGKPAQMKRSLIDEKKHLILQAPHPSPLSAYRGFFGSKSFSKTNTYLKRHNRKPIEWCL